MPKETFDAIDLKIMEALQVDARLTNADLAERAGLSPTPCHRRVRRLEDLGIVEKHVALLNAQALGLGQVTLVQVRLVRRTGDLAQAFERIVRDIPEVTDCYLVSGDADYLLTVRTRDLAGFEALLRERLGLLEMVGELRPTVVLAQTKRTTALPLSLCRPTARGDLA